MTRGLTLALVNLSLVAGLTLAAVDGFAQTVQPTTDGGSPVTSTVCGAGTLSQCGTKNLYQCEWSIEFNISPLTYSGGFSFMKHTCVVSGQIPLYKDMTQPAYPTCRSRTPDLYDTESLALFNDWYSSEELSGDGYYDESCEE